MIQNLISKKLLTSVHDVSSGGILLCLYEMCLSAKFGAKIKIPINNMNSHEYFFSEDQSRYLVEVTNENKDKVTNILEKGSVYYEILGKTQKDSLELDGEFNIKLSELNKLNSLWFKEYFKEK